MSLSIGASSNALSTLQSLLTQGAAAIGDAASTGGPLTALFQSLSGSSAAPQASATASGAPGSPFGAGTLAALLSLQGEQSSSSNPASPSQASPQLDNDGTVTQSDPTNAKRGHVHRHHHHRGVNGASSAQNQPDPLPTAPGSTLSSLA